MILKIEDLFHDSWLGQETLSRLQTREPLSSPDKPDHIGFQTSLLFSQYRGSQRGVKTAET